MKTDWGLLFLYFSAGVFWAVLINANIKNAIGLIKKRRAKKRVGDVIEKLKSEAGVLIANMQKPSLKGLDAFQSKKAQAREIHTFQWRKDGALDEVRIIIDPALETSIAGSQEDFERMIKEGNSGSMEELLKHISSGDAKGLKEVKDFVFSRKSVDQMSLAGLSPDELVAKMLKAAGRMD